MKRNPFAYYGKKLVVFFLSVLVLSAAVFFVAQLAPTDPLLAYYGERTEKMSVEEKAQARARLGLDAPVGVQYLRWLENAARGEFGISYQYKQSVTTVIGKRIGNTLILGGLGFVLTFVGSLLLGVLCAWKEDSLLDKLLCRLGTVMSAIPEFWLSLVLILIFCVRLRWLPSSGAYSVGKAKDLADRAVHLILPLVVVILGHLWYYAYLIRNRLLEEVRADYVLLCKSKGLSKGQILFGHCLRNTLPTYISLMAISVPHILGGTYIVETVFSYPGVGTLSYEAARMADYNMLMVLSMLTGVTVIFCNLLGQIINERIDPRIRAEEEREVARNG